MIVGQTNTKFGRQKITDRKVAGIPHGTTTTITITIIITIIIIIPLLHFRLLKQTASITVA
jgi:hypothetical protein